MTKYKCSVCGYVYDEKKEGKLWQELPDDWKCPVCGAKKIYFKQIDEPIKTETKLSTEIDAYLKEWERVKDDVEEYMGDIHLMAKTGNSVIEPMRTRKKVVSWDDILFKGAQLAKRPIHQDKNISTKTIIGKDAKRPLVIETPILISHMSFGALSKEAKEALSRGSALAKTAMSSGEGGIIDESINNAYKYIFEYVPNQYSVNEENLKRADAIEIKIGQSSKPGLGGHLPAKKVTRHIAKVRGKPENKDIHSPPFFEHIKTKEDLKKEIDMLRKVSGGKPIGVKIAAGNIEKDLEFIRYAGADFVTIDGRAGSTGASPKVVKDSTSIPTIFALARAKEYLKDTNIAIIMTGGMRISSDFAKALAMGADAIAIATSALMAIGCQQYKICNTGKCPVGIATHDPKLRARFDVELSTKRLYNFLKATTSELKDFARLTGNMDVHLLSVKDLATTNPMISDYTKIEHVGGKKNE